MMQQRFVIDTTPLMILQDLPQTMILFFQMIVTDGLGITAIIGTEGCNNHENDVVVKAKG
jgi:hypothetical protein